jgi:hypothetical protein
MEPISALVGAVAAVLATLGIREWFNHSRQERRLRRFRQNVKVPLEQIYQQSLKHLDLVVDTILQEHLIGCGFSLADIDDNLLRMARRLCLERLIDWGEAVARKIEAEEGTTGVDEWTDIQKTIQYMMELLSGEREEATSPHLRPPESTTDLQARP